MAVPWAGLVLQNEMTYSWDIISLPDIVSVASWVISNPLFPNVTLRCHAAEWHLTINMWTGMMGAD